MLGEFILREQIRKGDYGVVYRGEQPLIERDVVVKVLPRATAGETSRMRFLRVERVRTRDGGTALVYAATRKNAEKYAAARKAAGMRARVYHAGLDGEVRERARTCSWPASSTRLGIDATESHGNDREPPARNRGAPPTEEQILHTPGVQGHVRISDMIS